KRPGDNHREIRLTHDQYRALGKGLTEAEANGENQSAIFGVRLLALTGCRRGEIERLRWDEVDLAGGCLRLSDSKEGKSIRPLGSAAGCLIARLPKKAPFVLPGNFSESFFFGITKGMDAHSQTSRPA